MKKPPLFVLVALTAWRLDSLLAYAEPAVTTPDMTPTATTPASGATGASATGRTQWVNIDKNTYDLIDQEMKYHLDRAREAYILKNYQQAADEVQRANAQLDLRKNAISATQQNLQQVASRMQSGNAGTPDQLDKTFQQARNFQSHAQNALPMTSDVYQQFRSEPQYHFTQARVLFAKKDYNSASQAVQTGVTYLKLEEQRSNGQRRTQLDDAVKRLDQVAKDVKSGSDNSMAGLDQAIQNAERALSLPA